MGFYKLLITAFISIKVFIRDDIAHVIVRAVSSPNQGAAMVHGIRTMATVISGEHRRLASSEKKANVPKCRYMIGAVVIWQATVMEHMSVMFFKSFRRTWMRDCRCGYMRNMAVIAA